MRLVFICHNVLTDGRNFKGDRCSSLIMHTISRTLTFLFLYFCVVNVKSHNQVYALFLPNISSFKCSLPTYFSFVFVVKYHIQCWQMLVTTLFLSKFLFHMFSAYGPKMFSEKVPTHDCVIIYHTIIVQDKGVGLGIGMSALNPQCISKTKFWPELSETAKVAFIYSTS